MEIIKDEIQKINLNLPLKSSLVVVGYFDGFHSSHQKLLSLAQKLADSKNLKFILVTFEQKIADYLRHTNNDLISSEVKYQLLKDNFAIDYLIELKVNQKLVDTSKQKFLDFLEKELGTKMMVEGQDFSFGAQCTGKVEDLIKRFDSDEVVILKRKKTISATKIRQWLDKGKILKVNFWLKRRLELKISVNHFGTANLDFQLLYPKAKLKTGSYLLVDQNHQELSLEVNEKQKVIKVQDPKKILNQEGIYNLQFKKFMGTKK